MEDLDPEKLFLVFKDAYVNAMREQEIAKQDTARQNIQAHAEMDEMAAWDNYAMAALKHGSASSASECAVFANELLKERRKTFLIGDDE